MKCFEHAPLPAQGSLSVSDNEIHIWRVGLNVDSRVVKRLERLLSTEELGRLDRLRLPDDKRRFAVRRGILKTVLSAYTDIPGGQLRFGLGRHGKPDIRCSSQFDVPYFNTSSSADLALIAISAARPVGIDLEYIRPIDDILAIADRFFAKPEQKGLMVLPEELRFCGFYRIWTSKEAIIKADGAGLSMPLDSFVVDFDPRRPPRLISTAQKFQGPENLALYELDPGDNFSAALATCGKNLKINGWSLDIKQVT